MKLNRKYTLRDGGTLHVTEVERHRNGVAGDGFHAVRFTTSLEFYVGEGQPDRVEDVEFIGIVVDASFADDGTGGRQSYVYVVAPADLGMTMRGHDSYGDALVQSVNAYRRAWSKANGFSAPTKSELITKGRI